MVEIFERQIDLVGLKKKLTTIAAIEPTRISQKKREKMFVHAALSYLPGKARVTLYLRFWQDCTLAEIGEVLGMPEAMVNVFLTLSLRYLERELRPHVKGSRMLMREILEAS